MTMKLFHNPFSPNSKRLRAVSRELGLKVEEVLIDFTKGENRTPDYLAINPMGKVPAMRDGDFALWESPAVCIHLAQKSGKLWPKDPIAQYEALRWMFWNASHLEDGCYRALGEKTLKPMRGGTTDAARLQEYQAQANKYAAFLDKHLAKRTWICGEELTVADFAMAGTVEAGIAMGGLDFKECPALLAWLGRVQARDSWKAVS